MITIDNIMALANAYAESYRDALAPNVNALVDEAQTALRTALTASRQDAFARGMAVRPARAALAKDGSLIGEGTKAQPIDTSGERVEKIVGTVQVQKVLIERALQAISASILGTDTYRVSRRGDFASTVEKELRSALAQPVQEPSPMTAEEYTHLTTNGAKAWAGVNAQDLRDGGYQHVREHGIEVKKS